MTSAPVAFLNKLRSRVALRRADILGREQGQAMVRVVLSTIVVGYLLVHQSPLDFSQGAPDWLIYSMAFLTFSTVIAAAALRGQQSPAYRRVTTNVADVAAVTYLMVNTGESGAPLFVIYLWVTLGNGFRFGPVAMGISAVLSVTGFFVVIMSVDLWRQHLMLSAGVMVALVVLPACAVHLIRHLHRVCERADEASAAKSRFLARMSLKLRTPLNGILSITDLLHNNRRLTTADHELLGVIQESVSGSLRQIDNVLDFARIGAGKLARGRLNSIQKAPHD